MSDLSFAEVGEILRLLQHVEGGDVTLEWGDLKVHVRRVDAPATSSVAETSEPSATVSRSVETPVLAAARPSVDELIGNAPIGDEIPGHWVAVEAPMVGTFYRAAKPDEPAFVDVGDTVVPGDKVGLIEVMKLFTELTSDVAGKVARISADNAGLVEYGQPLLWIEPS